MKRQITAAGSEFLQLFVIMVTKMQPGVTDGRPHRTFSAGIAGGGATTVVEIAEGVPRTRPLDSDMGPVVTRGTEIALGRLLDLFGSASPALNARRRTSIGASALWRATGPQSMAALLSAYRIGARVAWERDGRAVAAGFRPATWSS